jgi:hypothetical protein
MYLAFSKCIAASGACQNKNFEVMMAVSDQIMGYNLIHPVDN